MKVNCEIISICVPNFEITKLFQWWQEDVSILLSAVVLARAVSPHQRHAPSQVRPGDLQVLHEDLPQQELPRLPHLEVPQARQGAHRSSSLDSET